MAAEEEQYPTLDVQLQLQPDVETAKTNLNKLTTESSTSYSSTLHENPLYHATNLPDNTRLADIRTDEDVQLQPEPVETSKKTKNKWKYSKSMQVLKPIRRGPCHSDGSPLDVVGLLSYLSVSWMTPLFSKAAKKTLERTDLWQLSDLDGAGINGRRFQCFWEEELERKGKDQASLKRVCFRFIRTRWIIGVCLLITYMFAAFFISALFVHKLLQYIEQPVADLPYGISIVVYIFMLNFLRVTCDIFYWTFNLRTATRLRCGALAVVFQKVCQLRSLQDRSIGEIVNICTNDSQRLFEVIIFGNFIISSLALIIASIIAVVMLVGISGLVGTLGTFMILWPFQMVVGKLTAVFRQKCIVFTDERVKKMNEVLTYIKLIKMYAWEIPFAKTIKDIRSREESTLIKSGYFTSWSITVAPITPNIATVITIMIHVALGNELTASETFTLVAILNVLRFVIGPTPWAIRCIAEGTVAMRRIQSILMMDEIKPLQKLPTDSTSALVISKGTFAWDKPKATVVDSQEMDEELIFSTNDDGSIVCFPNGSIESLTSAYKTNTACNPKSNIVHEDSKVFETPEEVPLRIEQTKNGSIVSGKENDGVGHVENGGFIKFTKEVPLEAGDVEEDRIVRTLFNIDLEVKKGQLIGICGSVGSGKSSLLAAILGNMHTVEGTCHINGSFAYAAQEPWVYNATLKNNILFGNGVDHYSYEKVIKACCLKQDIEILPSGDQTEIGERGINLSGGQKQRVSLARALYADRDVYLLDDPLSAVDTHVGQHIFTECIMGALKGKTVLFITHQLQYLKDCDIIFTIANGRIAERGTHKQLMADDSEYARLITAHHNTPEETDNNHFRENNSDEEELMDPLFPLSNVSSQISLGNLSVANSTQQVGELIQEEFRHQGAVKWTTYLSYIQAGGYGWCLFVGFLYMIVVGTLTFNNWWLSYWIMQEFNGARLQIFVLNNSSLQTVLPTYAPIHLMDDWGFYMTVYGCSLLAIILLGAVKSLFTMKTLLRASSNLHESLFAKVLRSPMSFFDTTPTGRILNRFSKDQDELDVMLPINMEIFTQNFLIVMFALIIICAVLPWFLIVVVPLIFTFLLIMRYYRRAARDIKRIENVSRSPWFSHISATVQGLSTIRAYSKNREFADRFITLLDNHSLPLMMFQLAARWAGVRLEALVCLVSTVTNLMVVILHGNISPPLAGLAVAYSIQISGMLQLMVMMASEMEARFTSAERIITYIKTLKSEAPAEVEEKMPPSDWPQKGEIQVKGYSMRYREGLPLVLTGVDCHIKAKEKIGIVGRTGSGKSSLGVGLFRLVEPASGQIIIDQLDSGVIGLHDLRSKLSIIPQDPVLFIGTIRYNLDPFDQHSDEKLWESLERTYMKDKISQLDQQLQAPVVEGGDNFSVGERQLLCMARALLRNSKILMMDEATAAIDTETDSLIQTTIREAFTDCTLLTIAHRLNTILDSDRVMLMEDGQIAEFDKPSNLLANQDSKFSQMIDAAKLNTNDLPNKEEDSNQEV